MPTAATIPEQVPMTTLLTGLGREATARVRRAMRPLGLGAQQFLVLKQLQVLGQTSQAELADALAIDPSNLAAIAADLCNRDLVERTRHEVDRRALRATAEPDREQLLRRTEGAMGAAESDLLAPLINSSASSSTRSCVDSPTASSSAPRLTMTPAQSDARSAIDSHQSRTAAHCAPQTSHRCTERRRLARSGR